VSWALYRPAPFSFSEQFPRVNALNFLFQLLYDIKLRRREKFLPYRDSNSDPSVVQSVSSLYTDCTISALLYAIIYLNVSPLVVNTKIPFLPIVRIYSSSFHVFYLNSCGYWFVFFYTLRVLEEWREEEG
jgi:hypothetical protein